jgi:4-amino-4-deoxy-L-arabinose transferase-like glycosyltransferase
VTDLSRRWRRVLLLFIVVVYVHNTLPYLTMMPRVNVDEPWLMERAYQVMKSGLPRQPMYGLNDAYMLQAGYPYLLAGWMEAFGVGLRQARLLGVLLGLAIVLIVASLGRRLLGASVGLCAALFLAADSNFLGGVRNARTDIPSVCFAAAALACYAAGREKKGPGWFFSGGVFAGLAMLCHGNAIWVAAVIGLWLILDYGWRVAVQASAYWFAGGVLTVLGPYLVVILLRWAEVRQQIANFASDRVPGSSVDFILRQIGHEIERYRHWYFGLVTDGVPQPLLWIFQAAVVAGLCVLLARLVRVRRQTDGRAPGEWLLLALVAGSVFLFAAFINNKVPVYLPHLLIGLSIAAGLAVAQGASIVRRAAAPSLVALFVFAYGAASMAYYERWYSRSLKTELLPYEQTAATLRALVPPGPKDLYGSPHFWTPFYNDTSTRFLSYGIGLQSNDRDRPVFLLVDETQWLPDMRALAGDRVSTERWADFIETRCVLDGVALGTSYGTMALYRCDLDRKPEPREPRIVGDGTVYVRGEQVMKLAGSELMTRWMPYNDPRRQPSQRPELTPTPAGLRIAGTGWPGIALQLAAVPGEKYLIRVNATNAREGDLLYLGDWQTRDVLSLGGGSSSGMPAPLVHEAWFPSERAFIASAPRVGLRIYSEAPRTDFTVSSVEIYRLQPDSARGR